MNFASDQTSPSVPDDAPNSPRSVEFTDALDRYIASYAAKSSLRNDLSAHGAPSDFKVPRVRSLVIQLTGFIAGALIGLGSAMSAGGTSFRVGIM